MSLNHLLETADLFALDIPFQLLTKLFNTVNTDNIIPLVVRTIIIGAVGLAIRRSISYLTITFKRELFPTCYISANDGAYLWVMAWIARDRDSQKQIKNYQLTTSEIRLLRGNKSLNTLKSHNASWSTKEIIGQVFFILLLILAQPLRIKYQGQYLWVKRHSVNFCGSAKKTEDHIVIQAFRFQSHAIRNFLVAAYQEYHSKDDQEILIYHAMRIKAGWLKPDARPARPWSSVILPEGVKDDVLKDIETFLSDAQMSWYAARGIPHRRGYLFHGAPGAGKTTLATAIASKLGLNIYVINPAQRGMDDAKLNVLFRTCPARSIILIEDIDCIFPSEDRGRTNMIKGSARRHAALVDDGNEEEPAEPTNTEEHAPGGNGATISSGGPNDLALSTVTLSGVLNAIDGVSSQEGCILIGTTNHPGRLDSALKRAGRFDCQIPFYSATPAQAHSLFLHFYPLSDFSSSDIIADTWEEEKDSADITSQEDIDALSTDFVNTVFPTGDAHQVGGRGGVKVSMAALQAFLLKYKDTPWKAVSDAKGWIESLESLETPEGKSGMKKKKKSA